MRRLLLNWLLLRGTSLGSISGGIGRRRIHARWSGIRPRRAWYRGRMARGGVGGGGWGLGAGGRLGGLGSHGSSRYLVCGGLLGGRRGGNGRVDVHGGGSVVSHAQVGVPARDEGGVVDGCEVVGIVTSPRRGWPVDGWMGVCGVRGLPRCVFSARGKRERERLSRVWAVARLRLKGVRDYVLCCWEE